MSHTPGPWRRDHVEIYGANGKHVIWELGNNNEADIDLVIAAPDMLEALKAAAGYLENVRIDLETGTKKATTLATIREVLHDVRSVAVDDGCDGTRQPIR